jgi:purine-nucleoside phosphorylase
MPTQAEKVAAAVAAIRRHWSGVPRAGVILGTGLGSVAAEIDRQATLPFEQIPHFAPATVVGHAGRLVCGNLAGLAVVAMEGRFHAYEGNSLEQLAFPVRVIKALGADLLIVCNASGAMNPRYRRADIVVIEDHINLLGSSPLVGPHDESFGPRFPDMSAPYDKRLADCALEIARQENFAAHQGVYVAVLGPQLETRAEYRFLRAIGADVVGMSTVPEVIVAVQCGMRVLGLSAVTDLCLPDALQPVAIEDILAVAAQAEPKLRKLILGVLAAEAKSAALA